jgi:hypothetical protein
LTSDGQGCSVPQLHGIGRHTTVEAEVHLAVPASIRSTITPIDGVGCHTVGNLYLVRSGRG